MEPERKLPHDITPETRPKLGVIDGGGQTTPDRPGRDTMQALPETADDVSDAESNAATGANPDRHLHALPEPSHINNVRGKDDKKAKAKGWFKKGGPAVGVGGIVGIVGLIMVGLTSPSLLIVQLKETMVGRFNTQLSTMEARSNKLIFSKINGATSGYCNSVISVRCKFTSMSEKQVKKLAAAGITVNSEATTVTGRVKPLSIEFNGETIQPNQFASRTASSVEFRNALKQAYNPKYAGFVGKAWSNVATKYKASKQMPELDAEEDPEKARAKLTTISAEGFEDSGSGKVTANEPIDPNCTADDCAKWTEEDARQANEKSGVLKDSGSSAANDIRGKLSGINAGAVGSFVKITGPIDSACQIYGGVTALTYAAKTIRAAQLVRYALIFMTVADAIKAGESPDPADMALLGGIITAVVTDPNDPTRKLINAGTDSFGYKYAAYGDAKGSLKSMTVANRFMAGGGMVGDLNGITNTALSFFPEGRQGANKTCGVLANPIVQGVSIVAGIAALFVPGANVTKIALGATASAAVGLAMATLPALLGDIVAGTVTEGIVGEEAVNAITSGAGNLMSDSLAGENGNGPMTKEDTLAYLNLQQETQDRYIADELQQTSPFDATNPNTFIGSIVAKLIPLQSSSNPLTTLSSLLNSSFNSIIPKSKALTTQQQADALNVCNDLDVTDAGYAADPFCNVIRGIPPKYLNKDPLVVVDELIASGDLSADGAPQTKFQDFVKQCMQNEGPLGYSDPTIGYNNEEAQKCIINDSNANYYLHFADLRVELGLSDEDIAQETSGGQTNASITPPPDTEGYGQGWVLKRGVDYSQYACDPRMDDLGVITVNDFNFTYRVCGEKDSTRTTGCGMRVGINAMTSTNYMNMKEAAAGAGVNLGLADGFRRNNGCETSADSNSRHFHGTAMDLYSKVDGNTICWTSGPDTATANACRQKSNHQGDMVRWLDANAAKYGFLNLKSEAWHWSTGEL